MKVKGIKLNPTQERIYEACKLDSPYFIITVSSGRQIGKSTVAGQVMCNWAFNNKNYSVCCYLPTWKQCKEQYTRLEKGLRKVEGLEFNKTDLTIKLSNGSLIQYQTAETDTMRGSTYQSIVVDEACFVKGEIFSAAILPTVAVSLSNNRGKVLLISTPKSKNWFFDYFMIEEDNKISIKATSEEGGLISKEVLEQIKKTTPEHIYRNEYLAEFLEAGEGVFAYRDCILSEPSKHFEGCIAGLDFGMENDYTALAIMNNKGELVHLERWRGIDWTDCINLIVAQLKRFNVNRVFAETNGIGNMPAKTLQKKFYGTSFWVTTNKSKVDIINKLSSDFKQELIRVPDIDYLMTELDAYTLDYTPATGKVTYGARSGFNDDCVMALAIANWNRITTGKRFTM